jgi:peptidoglycan hydrolase-like protein with peptidoglycan-binding domain
MAELTATRPGPVRHSRKWLPALAMVLAAGLVLTWILVANGNIGNAGNTTSVGVPVGTAAVIRTNVNERTQVSGVLGYTGSFAVIATVPGIVTAEPSIGAVVTQGHVLYELDGVPIHLLYGMRPAWRGFAMGMSDGPDVAQLERDLVALGFDSGRTITVDQHFTAATADAIRRWQRREHVRVTGTLPLGQVAFLPGPLRVNAQPVATGGQTQPGQPVVTGTSVERAVTLTLTTAQAPLVHLGDHVLVTLPNGTTTTPGIVGAIGPVQFTSPGSGNGGGGGQSQNQNGPAQASVPVTVRLTNPAVGAGLDQAPVQIEVTDAAHAGVLAVPITALLATSSGGYSVTAIRAGSRVAVPVTVGLFDDATQLVEVAGTGLSAGDRVEVPTG